MDRLEGFRYANGDRNTGKYIGRKIFIFNVNKYRNTNVYEWQN